MMDRAYTDILEGAGHLADLLYTPPTNDAALDKAREELINSADKLGRVFGNFRESADQYAAKLTSSDDWREVDAILFLPMLDPKKRETLLDLVGSKELSPDIDSASDASIDLSDVKPDPAFWYQAVGLAWVEASMLKIAGMDDSALWTQVLQARSNWEKNPTPPLGHELHRSPRPLLGRTPAGRDPRKARRPRSERRRNASRPHRRPLGPRLPVAELRRLDEDPCRGKEELERRELIIWQGLRLCDDFASREARVLLTDIRQNDLPADEATALRKAIDLAGSRDPRGSRSAPSRRAPRRSRSSAAATCPTAWPRRSCPSSPTHPAWA